MEQAAKLVLKRKISILMLCKILSIKISFLFLVIYFLFFIFRYLLEYSQVS